MELTKTLQSLGIGDKQVAVYLAALELGTATVGEVAKKAGIKRTSVYNFLPEMKTAGLISEIKKGRTNLIIPSDPQMLIARTQENLTNVKSALPELLGLFNLPAHKPKVRFYEGVEGIKTAYQDILDTGDTIYGFSDYEKMFTLMPADYLWSFPPERVKRKIKFYCIAQDGPKGREVKKQDKEHWRETRLAKTDFETEINIYGNKVAMMSFRRPGAAVIIEDTAIAKTLKSVWKAWWENLPKTLEKNNK